MKLDRWGMGLSLACAVHCLALPLLAALAFVGEDHFLHHPWLEGSVIGGAALVGYLTLGTAYRRHRRPLPLAVLTAGLLLLGMGHLYLPEGAGTLTAVAGALALVSAQLLNRRWTAACCPAVCCEPVSPAGG
jgi:hypothetical protein